MRSRRRRVSSRAAAGRGAGRRRKSRGAAPLVLNPFLSPGPVAAFLPGLLGLSVLLPGSPGLGVSFLRPSSTGSVSMLTGLENSRMQGSTSSSGGFLGGPGALDGPGQGPRVPVNPSGPTTL